MAAYPRISPSTAVGPALDVPSSLASVFGDRHGENYRFQPIAILLNGIEELQGMKEPRQLQFILRKFQNDEKDSTWLQSRAVSHTENAEMIQCLLVRST